MPASPPHTPLYEKTNKQSYVLFVAYSTFSKRSKVSMTLLALSQTSPGFYVSAVKPFENTVRKGEIAHNEQFLFFPQRFLLF